MATTLSQPGVVRPIEPSPEPYTYFPQDSTASQLMVPSTLMVGYQKEVESKVKQRRSIACNAKYICYALPAHPNARVLARYNSNRVLLKGHKEIITDISFVSFIADIVITIANDGFLVLNQLIEDTDASLKATIIGVLEIGTDKPVWGIGPAVNPNAETVAALSPGFILVAQGTGSDSKLTSFNFGSMIKTSEPQFAYQIPSTSLATCNGEFAVSSDATRVIVGHEAMASVYLLPSPAAHHKWTANAGDSLTAVSFGPTNDTVITFSRDNSFVRVWNLSDERPQCVQTLCLGDGTAKWRVALDFTRTITFFLLQGSPTVAAFGMTAEGALTSGYNVVTEASLEKVPTQFLVTAKKKEPNDPVVILRLEDAITKVEYTAAQFRMPSVPEGKRSDSAAPSDVGFDVGGLLRSLSMTREGSTPSIAEITPKTTKKSEDPRSSTAGGFSEADLLARLQPARPAMNPSPPVLPPPPYRSSTENSPIILANNPPPSLPLSPNPQIIPLPIVGPQATHQLPASTPNVSRQNDDAEIDNLLRGAQEVTSSMSLAVRQIAELQSSVNQLTSAVKKAEDRFSSEVGRRLITPLDSMALQMQKSSSSGGGSGGADALASVQQVMTSLPNRVEEMVRSQVTSYATTLLAQTRQTIQMTNIPPQTETSIDTKSAIRRMLQHVRDAIRCEALATSISDLNKSVTHKAQPAVKDVILAHLQVTPPRLDDALSITLEMRNPDLVLWLLTEACPLASWQDAVVDVSLKPINVLALVQNLSMALSKSTSSNSGSLRTDARSNYLDFLKDAVLSYNNAWRENVRAEIYPEIRAICARSLTEFQKASGELSPSEQKSMKAIMRVLTAIA